jgi:protein-L-isoaspartate(D-aspartate) O-methyltransferase
MHEKRHELVDQLVEQYGIDSRAAAAMRAVPRHEFVPESKRAAAYEDHPLPIGGDHVYSVEYHDSLTRKARDRLARTGYGSVSVRAGDGRDGWPECAPYDRAYLTCAADEFPETVVEQVRPGGLVLAPIGSRRQRLVRVRRRADGSLDREEHGGVRFVPLQ